MNEPKTESPKTVKVRIYAPHTHNGKRIAPPAEGAEIEVTEKQADFLKRTGISDRPAPAPVVAPAAPAVTTSKVNS